MKNFTFLVLPAILGIITGVGHGIISHKADLPVSLTEQVALSLQIGQFPEP
ncbi:MULTISPECIES: hypothetical protein [Okeania]|uniref:hypothetical protein n=1 Tax=Okeania TaxID=1458928 RepID=UPI001864CDEB|nr:MULTISPECIES: hypothetical protein [Okeania]